MGAALKSRGRHRPRLIEDERAGVPSALADAAEAGATLSVVMLTAVASVDLAVEAMRRGRLRLPDQAVRAGTVDLGGAACSRTHRPIAREPSPQTRSSNSSRAAARFVAPVSRY